MCSTCLGWRGTAELRDSTATPVCKLVKKERKHSEEDEDEILSKLQRDDVSASNRQQPASQMYESIFLVF